MTTVTAILIRPATAVETTDIGRSVGDSDFGLRFLAAMMILGRVRLPCSLTQTLPCRFVPDLSTASRACATKRLSGIVNQTLPNGDGLQIYAIAFSLAGEGGSTFAPSSQRHGTHSETSRSLVMDVGFQGEGGSRSDIAKLSRMTRIGYWT